MYPSLINWRRIMKYWIIEDSVGDLIRIEWNELATFNLQSHISGEWVDFHCFTCYGIDTEQKALEHAQEVLENENVRGTDAWENYCKKAKPCW